MTIRFLRNPSPGWTTIFSCALAVLTTLSISIMPPPASADDACSARQRDLEAFLKAPPDHCQQDADCDGYYIRADSCAPAIVLAKPGISKTRGPELLKLQARVRDACGKQWGQRPACAPIPFQAKCRQNRCVDGSAWLSSKPITAQAPVGKGNYSYAVVRNGCAPWDGPAIAIYLTKLQVTSSEIPLPSIAINLWRNLPPPVNQPISLQGDLGLGNRCLAPEHCESAVAGTVTLTTYDENGAAGTYELKFKNGEVERGSFQARWQKLRQFCG